MPFLKLQTNISVSIELVYDNPKKHPDNFNEGKFKYLYGFKPIAGGFDVWDATESAHNLIQKLGLGKGSTLTVIKEEIEGTNAKRFRINGKIMDDFQEDFTGKTIAEAQGEPWVVLIGKFQGVLDELKEMANAQTRVSGLGHPPEPPLYDEKPPAHHEDMPFPDDPYQ